MSELLGQAVAEFEAGRVVTDGPPVAYFEIDGHGDIRRFIYDVVVSGGIKKEGEPFPALYATESEAVSAWAKSIREYTIGKAGILCWRSRPRLEQIAAGPTGCTVYSRLVFADVPPWARVRTYRPLVTALPGLMTWQKPAATRCTREA